MEERKNLGFSLNESFYLNDNKEDKFQIISQHNEKVETDSVTMIAGNIPEKSTDYESTSIPSQISTRFT